MQVFSIISEYNPLHKGHIYQIDQIKKNNESFVIAFMSGSFVQRGEPSFISKFDRAESAILNGVDLVLEMPTILSLQSAQYFSSGSIEILNKLNICTHLSFGYESMDFSNFKKIISLEKNFQDEINNKVNYHISQGLSYKKAYSLAVEELDPSIDPNIFLANNTLAFEYIKALARLKSPMDIYPIVRSGANYSEETIKGPGFQSATALRRAILNQEDVSSYLAQDLYEKILVSRPPSLDDYSHIFYYLAFIENKSPEKTPGYENGMLNLLKKNFSSSLEAMIDLSHNKRYSKSRLRRFVLNYILDLDQTDVDSISQINYIKPLAFNKKGTQLLAMIKEKSSLEIINKPKDLAKLDPYNQKILGLDYRAYNLYCLKDPKNRKREYLNQPFISLDR